MNDHAIRIERAQNLWTSFERKHLPLARAGSLVANPQLDFDLIGGLAGPKEEILTYACAATDPGVYGRWGTHPPSGILLIGQHGVGKKLLAAALATRTETSFLRVDVPRLAIDLIHSGGKVGDFITAWTAILEEMPQLTVFFDELEFIQAEELGEARRDLPAGPIMDFLLELVDRAIGADEHLVVASTAHPDTVRHAFMSPGRFERIVEVVPSFPEDVVEALRIHAAAAEKRAGRPLFDGVEWASVVGQVKDPTPGEWVRMLHAVLRRKARCEAAGEEVTPVTTADMTREAQKARETRARIRRPTVGHYV
ncbi:MAG: AAA family ATPase [Myxococcota bacterium]